jgi:pseudaminic acid biosynthesis-associated methylase
LTNPLEAWRGAFGTAYTERNVVDWRARVSGFRQALEGLEIRSALEVGCNRGHNVMALRDVFGESVRLEAVEPNEHARRIAAAAGVFALPGEAGRLPFGAREFDLVFTVGVLIHIATPDLPDALREIARVAGRYILAAEYFSERDIEIPYRGREGLLWKRDFGAWYERCCAPFRIEREGFLARDEGFDDLNWWLLAR